MASSTDKWDIAEGETTTELLAESLRVAFLSRYGPSMQTIFRRTPRSHLFHNAQVYVYCGFCLKISQERANQHSPRLDNLGNHLSGRPGLGTSYRTCSARTSAHSENARQTSASPVFSCSLPSAQLTPISWCGLYLDFMLLGKRQESCTTFICFLTVGFIWIWTHFLVKAQKKDKKNWQWRRRRGNDTTEMYTSNPGRTRAWTNQRTKGWTTWMKA